MSAHTGALEAIERVLNRGGDADDVLREVVSILHTRLGRFVRISFVEGDRLVPGPAEGEETDTTPFPISFQGRQVAELEAGGPLSAADREAIRARSGDCLALRARRLGHRRRGVGPLIVGQRARPEGHSGRAPQLPATPLPCPRCSRLQREAAIPQKRYARPPKAVKGASEPQDGVMR